MSNQTHLRLLRWALLLPLGFLLLRYGLPLVLPFLAGFLLALAAEPAVRFLSRRLRFRRGIAAFAGVSLTLILLTGLGLLLFSLIFQGLRRLTSIAPDLETAARQGLISLQDWLLSLALSAPEGVRGLLTKTVLGLFDSGGSLFSQILSTLPGLAAGLLSHITGGFLGIGTAVLSAYLISPRLPDLKQRLMALLPDGWSRRCRPVLGQLRGAVTGWLSAQARLMGLTFCILLAGLLLLRIRHAPVWAAVIALVDAVPMLGTGLVLVPWSIVSFLQEAPARGLGLLGLFVLATVTRSVLEPRLVGHQLGLDPLLALIALYLGYQLLGLPGLLLAPVLAVAGTQLLNPPAEAS